MTNKTRQRLLDAPRSCHAFHRYTLGLDLTEYEHQDIVRDAVERRLGTIGEAPN
jgi:uncharacterized protein with HEPN domain